MDYIFSCKRGSKEHKTLLVSGLLTTKQVVEMSGVTERKIRNWGNCHVFGTPQHPGSGYTILWLPKVVEVLKTLDGMGDAFGMHGGATDLYRKIVENYDKGILQVTDHISLKWEPTYTEDEHQAFIEDVVKSGSWLENSQFLRSI